MTRLPFSAAAVPVLILCSALLGFSAGRDLPTAHTCPVAHIRQ